VALLPAYAGRHEEYAAADCMLAYVIIPAMGIAGYAGAPLWVVLFGAAGIATEGWWSKLQQLWRQPGRPWSTKTTAYFITGVIGNIVLSAISHGIGRLARAAIG
jgi:hypothetical protein